MILLLALLVADGDLLRDESEVRVPLYATEVEGFRIGMSLGAQARASIPFGAADEGNILISGNTIFIGDHLSYLDLFNPGFGFSLEADLMFRPIMPLGVDPRYKPADLGPYVAFGWDWFSGSSTRDENGVRVEPDTLRLPTIMVGVKGTGTVEGNFYGDYRFGVGAAHWPSLDARFEPGGKGELFAESWEFAMECRMHFGWKLGPLGVVFGMGGRLFAPPDPGRSSTLDPGIFWTLDFELGAEIGF
jgi:hypothetical protein